MSASSWQQCTALYILLAAAVALEAVTALKLMAALTAAMCHYSQTLPIFQTQQAAQMRAALLRSLAGTPLLRRGMHQGSMCAVTC